MTSRLALRPVRSFLFINVEPRTVLYYFWLIVFIVSAVSDGLQTAARETSVMINTRNVPASTQPF